MFSNEDDDAIQKIDSSYTSRVAEIFEVILKSLGIEIEYINDEEIVKTLNDRDISAHDFNGKKYFCTDYQFYLMERVQDIKEEILRENPVLTESALSEMICKEMKKRKYVNGPLVSEMGDIEIEELIHNYNVE